MRGVHAPHFHNIFTFVQTIQSDHQAKMEDKTIRRIVIGIIAFLSIVIVANLAFGPVYHVWEQSLTGKAELQKAEYTRQVKVLEAKALKDAAVLQAEAEVERAKGASAANKILGESLKGNPEYLTYLYIQNLENSNNDKEKTVIYVPTEKGIPIPITESGRLNSPQLTSTPQVDPYA